MFNDKINTTISNGVETIGGKYIVPKRIFTVSWSWTDNEGQLHTKDFNNIIYFTDSSVNILSETTLDESMKDYDDGTWVLTKQNIIFILGGLGITKRQYLTQKIIFHN